MNNARLRWEIRKKHQIDKVDETFGQPEIRHICRQTPGCQTPEDLADLCDVDPIHLNESQVLDKRDLENLKDCPVENPSLFSPDSKDDTIAKTRARMRREHSFMDQSRIPGESITKEELEEICHRVDGCSVSGTREDLEDSLYKACGGEPPSSPIQRHGWGDPPLFKNQIDTFERCLVNSER